MNNKPSKLNKVMLYLSSVFVLLYIIGMVVNAMNFNQTVKADNNSDQTSQSAPVQINDNSTQTQQTPADQAPAPAVAPATTDNNKDTTKKSKQPEPEDD